MTSQAEIQADVQRFSGLLADRLGQAMEPLATARASNVRGAALRRQLNYLASIFDIASGPIPEVAALDLMVFIKLCRAVLLRYWIPEVYGAQGHALADAFLVSEADLDVVVNKVLGPTERQELDVLVADWLAENPHQVVVEAVRLGSFSEHIGKAAEAQARRARGLLASVKSATQAADQALLLAERAVFLAHRLPFVFRLQARLAAYELTSDAVLALKDKARAWAIGIATFLGVALGTGYLAGKRRPRRIYLQRARA